MLYCMETMNARINWIPHIRQIRSSQEAFAIDFGALTTQVPMASTTLGIYQELQFQFTNQNLLLLINEMKSAGHTDD